MYNTLTTVKLTEHITCMNSGTTEFTEPSRALSDDTNENNLIFLTEGEVGSSNENDITLPSEGEWDDAVSNVSASSHASLVNVTEASALETIEKLVVNEKDDPHVILSNIRKKNLNKVILGHLNINHLSGKFEDLRYVIKDKMDVLVLTETKIEDSYLLVCMASVCAFTVLLDCFYCLFLICSLYLIYF